MSYPNKKGLGFSLLKMAWNEKQQLICINNKILFIIINLSDSFDMKIKIIWKHEQQKVPSYSIPSIYEL